MALRRRPGPPSHELPPVHRRFSTRKRSGNRLLQHSSGEDLQEAVSVAQRKRSAFCDRLRCEKRRSPAVIAQITEAFTELALQEAGLTTHVVKNMIFVQPYARSGWNRFLDSTPKDPSASLPIHDIPDGSHLKDPLDLDSPRVWPTEEGINVLGTPLGPPDFIESYLFGKGHKHRQLLSFITEVIAIGFPREAVAMLTGAAGPHLTHLLKSLEKNESTQKWTAEMNTAHVSTWLHCLTVSPDLEHALGPTKLDMLIEWLDLPPSYGGSGLNSLVRSADEELLGSFAGIAASLIAFCRKNGADDLHSHGPGTGSPG
jgi:hypothetical protein